MQEPRSLSQSKRADMIRHQARSHSQSKRADMIPYQPLCISQSNLAVMILAATCPSQPIKSGRCDLCTSFAASANQNMQTRSFGQPRSLSQSKLAAIIRVAASQPQPVKACGHEAHRRLVLSANHSWLPQCLGWLSSLSQSPCVDVSLALLPGSASPNVSTWLSSGLTPQPATAQGHGPWRKKAATTLPASANQNPQT